MESRSQTSGPSIDDNENLYVLVALRKWVSASHWLDYQLIRYKEHYETISHCVILVTVDNSSCHRGLIVMFTYEEAKLAMSGLMRTWIKSVSSRALSNGAGLIEIGEVEGHTVDVSWAVIQCSQGEYWI